jgi:hypothetical protein
VKLDRLPLELGPKAYRSPAHELSYGASGIYRIEGTVRSQRRIAHVLEIGAYSAGLQIERHHVVLLVEDEHQTLFRIGADRMVDRR